MDRDSDGKAKTVQSYKHTFDPNERRERERVSKRRRTRKKEKRGRK